MIQPFLITIGDWAAAALHPVVNSPGLTYEGWRSRFLIKRLRLVIALGAIAYTTFIALELTLLALNQPNRLAQGWLGMSVSVEIALGFCWWGLKTRWGRHHPGVIFLGCSWSITLIEQLWATSQGFALFGVISWTLVFLTQAALIPVRWPLHLLAQLGVLGYYWGVNGWLGLHPEDTAALQMNGLFGLYLFWFCAICNLAVHLYERLQRVEFEARQQLHAEREKSERLLLNILPEPIALQLKREPVTIADSFAEVSVLFADIVGFTQLSTQISPIELVNLLNQIFSAFDQLAERHGLEKIKTIGDAYMVVGGLPVPREDHAEAIADMALDMQQALRQFNQQHHQNFQIRLGINTGPVVAGVIGIKKFIYDLWGDTVNLASRMESHGLPDEIQVSSATYERLRSHYLLELRGLISVKGRGEMTTYFLKGRKS